MIEPCGVDHHREVSVADAGPRDDRQDWQDGPGGDEGSFYPEYADQNRGEEAADRHHGAGGADQETHDGDAVGVRRRSLEQRETGNVEDGIARSNDEHQPDRHRW